MPWSDSAARRRPQGADTTEQHPKRLRGQHASTDDHRLGPPPCPVPPCRAAAGARGPPGKGLVGGTRRRGGDAAGGGAPPPRPLSGAPARGPPRPPPHPRPPPP